MNYKKFTLIEILVSFSLIAILMTLLQPSLRRMSEVARSSECQSNLKHLMIAVHLYSDDHDDVLVPFAGPNAEKPYWHLGNWTGKLVNYLYPDFDQPRFYSTNDFKMASCPSTDQRFGYGHNYAYIGAERRDPFGPGWIWLIKKKRHEATNPNRTTVLVDNVLTYEDPAPNRFGYWRSFVRPGGGTLQDNTVNFIHNELSANVGWLDGSVSSRFKGDGYVNPGNFKASLDWWTLAK